MALDATVRRDDHGGMEPTTSMRVDKWLWAVRVFQTRSLAAAACRAHQVCIEEHPVKPARELKPGEVLTIQKDGITRKYRVLGFVPQRVSAAAAQGCCEDITAPEELARLKERREHANQLVFPKGHGRPSKKDRRAVELLLGWTGEGNE